MNAIKTNDILANNILISVKEKKQEIDNRICSSKVSILVFLSALPLLDIILTSENKSMKIAAALGLVLVFEGVRATIYCDKRNARLYKRLINKISFMACKNNA